MLLFILSRILGIYNMIAKNYDHEDIKLEEEIQRIFSCVVLNEKLSQKVHPPNSGGLEGQVAHDDQPQGSSRIGTRPVDSPGRYCWTTGTQRFISGD